MEKKIDSLEQLRNDIEVEHRFKTGISGYDKKEVNDYLEKIQKNFIESQEGLHNEIAQLKLENGLLTHRISELQDELNAARATKAAREAAQEKAFKVGEKAHIKIVESGSDAEQTVRESIVESLRATNERLLKENRYKQMEITNLQEQFNSLKSALGSGSLELFALNDRLGELLSGKMSECMELIRVWQTEIHGTVDAISTHSDIEEDEKILSISGQN